MAPDENVLLVAKRRKHSRCTDTIKTPKFILQE